MTAQQTFIAEVAQRILTENASMEDIVVVFPNRRAGLFFRKELAQLIDKPVFMPEVYSLEDYLMQFSPYQKIETLEAIFELFEVYKLVKKKSETFDKFFFWGEMILRDFEEIDQYLVETKKLFTGIKTQKELDEAFFYLDEEDKEVIQSFWSSFLPDTTATQKAFLETWRILLPLYEGFKERLRQQGRGFGGMIYRDIAERLEAEKIKPTHKLYLAGFNALTKSEETIFKYFVREVSAEIIWDVDDYYFSNRQQEAGTFLREYAADTLLGRSFPKEPQNRIKQPKKFTATGVSLEVGQAKTMGEAIKAIAQAPDFEPSRTVVVLPQEHMLFPVLHSIPDVVDKVNITMGYPLKDTSVYSLLESALDLQRLRKTSTVKGISFYHRPVQELLLHPLLMPLEENKATQWLAEIKKKNRILIPAKEFDFKHELFQFLFAANNNPVQYLIDILRKLYTHWHDKDRELETEFISRFFEQLQHVAHMIGDKADALGYEFFTALFKRLARSFKVPFTGEPLDGLQIMGILETRNLDFDRVYILNMNEGSWPAQPRRGSFVPYNIRKAFGLPVYENNDAMYAYLFYRLLQRANEVHFYYNTVSEFNVNGEISRFVRQLEAESDHTITKKILANPVKTQSLSAITIKKTSEVLQKMQRFTTGYDYRDQSKLTPSALITYLTCRLKFYFKYVAKLYEADDVQEEMDAAVFGNILHNAMEILYKEFTKKQKRSTIEPNDVMYLQMGIRGALRKAFVDHYNAQKEENFEPEGRSIIAFEILEKFANEIIKHDAKYAPFRVLGLEASTREGYHVDLPITSGGQTLGVRIKGIIDRIDRKGETVRVIDYKTGRDDKTYESIEKLKDRTKIKDNKTILQVFYYSYLYWKKNGVTHQIEPGIFNSKDLFKDDFSWRVHHKKSKNELHDFRPMAEEFEEFLTELLSEIYDPEVTFDQTDDYKNCEYCPYKDICGR
ncbi:PD-(D/E)XK nuclease family protein [Fulvivirga sp. RKSG066]|uniref:PD-(D/E)XK nuclease family protein n=1 Tax=Fulvivirga aurantia TaxID=2529383 RepID=UPI0012BD35B7|nr:PD-(D/E)XK nuclease family protein [Fulvivirga aurantia]MTI21133.1 PD-(D/E)XK nuclease family protein [Fulvivirga aurantia]